MAERLSVYKFSVDRIEEGVQDPAFRELLSKGWRVVFHWAVEDERSRLPGTLMVVLAPPLPAPPSVSDPSRAQADLLDRALQVASLVALVAILAASLWR